jgi:hypothetical protein
VEIRSGLPIVELLKLLGNAEVLSKTLLDVAGTLTLKVLSLFKVVAESEKRFLCLFESQLPFAFV